MYSVYLDEALQDATGQLEFPEYYAYIRDRDQEPVPLAQRVPIGEQTLQKQVKDNDDILFSTNEVFVPPVSNAPTKLDLSSLLERSSFLASNGSDPQLIAYGDRVTLIVIYETTGLFPNGYLFKSYPKEAIPKTCEKVIALVGTYAYIIIKHDGKLASSSQPIYIITNVFIKFQLIAPFDLDGHAYNTFYIIDDLTCKACAFNLYFETKVSATSTQEIGSVPDVILHADGKSMEFPESVYRNAGRNSNCGMYYL
ncbi:MAG: hypothetical protein EZS28_035685 [Streblomastix strix]|uniref:Uncharacterized protein n=1 Tax=Streblomastix strix TaxID=222440 RepID=A0A5J4UEI1_9EUKA|nr:MAG: hypothetical protein EZS28_035685 [Streblomastix strix]